MRKNQQQHPLIKTDNKGSIEITEDELKQVTGGATLPGMHKTLNVTLKRG
jgi:bacteriocin-like protein